MKCEEIMKRDVDWVTADVTARHAARRMHQSNVGFLPVCSEAGRVLGCVTDRDLALRVLGEGRAPDTPVEQVMSRQVVACSPQDELERAEELLGAHQKSRIMCLDATGRLVGVISLSDIVRHDGPEAATRTLREVTEREAHLYR